MYVAIEKLEHGLTRLRGEPSQFYELAEQDQWEAAEEWLNRGYTILESVHGEAFIILDGTKAIGIIGIYNLRRNIT